MTRAFTREFVDYMEQADAWPAGRAIIEYIRGPARTATRARYSNVIRGGYEAPHYTERIVSALASCVSEEFSAEHLALTRYLKAHGVHLEDDPTMEELLALLCTQAPADLESDPIGQERQLGRFVDWMCLRARSVKREATVTFVRAAGYGIQVQGGAAKLASWIYYQHARSRLNEAIDLSLEQAHEYGALGIGLSWSEFSDAIEAWAGANPWSVVCAKRGGKLYGVSILLPVSPAIYDQVRAGKRYLADVPADQLRQPSDRFIYLALAENPDDFRFDQDEPSKTLLVASVAQHAALMRYERGGVLNDYRFLAPCATERNVTRMAHSDFRKLNATEMRTGWHLWERQINPKQMIGIDRDEELLIERLAEVLPSEPSGC